MGHYVGLEIIVSAVDYTLLKDWAVVSVSRHYPEIYWIVLKENRGEKLSVGPVTRPMIKSVISRKQFG